ncbi:MAG: aminotransferase [Chloroflexi bacterium HGW-Chloroflexi-10]|nr:MAG: aminotransferase [Chloroflexi bacterium HGW-Chloroflexi-10]
MQSYPIPMIPGPVQVPDQILSAYLAQYGSADLELEFLELYQQTQKQLQQLLGTKNDVTIHSGEGMIALWGALKSCLLPGDRVLALATGVFGYGIGEMGKSIGAQVKTIGFAYNETLHDWEMIEKAIVEFQPKMITVVHAETPSGTLNPIEKLGQLKRKHEIPLLYVDTVASVGGTPVEVDEWGIDLALGGSQKVLSCPPDMSFLAVSPAAWDIIEQIGYVGYDALLPFREAVQNFSFPYTPNWYGMAALNKGAALLLDEGLTDVFRRHQETAVYCREQLLHMGYELFPAVDAIPSPTVTAVHVPSGYNWETFDKRLRKDGLAVGGSYGPLTGKVFRLGHMGSQANMQLLHQAMQVLEAAIKEK